MTRGITWVDVTRVQRGERLSADSRAVLVAAAVVGVAAAIGTVPVAGRWLPHVEPGMVFAPLIAIAVVLWGPEAAARLKWLRLLGLGYLVSAVWAFSLGGGTSAQSWLAHVSGSPPGASLVFGWLDRAALSGGTVAGILCVLVGSLATVAVPLTLSALHRCDAARATMPFAVLFPGAVWMGGSVDGLIAGVTGAGIMLIALATHGFRAGRWYAVPWSLLGGALLGFGSYLSYLVPLAGLIALAVIVLGNSLNRALPIALLGAAVVVVVFTTHGVSWFDHYHHAAENTGPTSSYAFSVWANVASLALAIGPALVAAVRRTVVAFARSKPPEHDTLTAPWEQRWRYDPALLLVGAAALAIVLTDLSGASYLGLERGWLPFTVWLLPAAALMPMRRRWLAAQAVTALVVNALVLTCS